MKLCEKCKRKFGYVEFFKHKCYTLNEWKKFYKPFSAEHVGNDYQFFNHISQRMESYDSLTVAEVLLQKYDVEVIDHANKRKVGKMCPTPLKETLKSIPSKITPENIHKGFKMMDKGMSVFNRAVQDFGKSMDLLTKEMSEDARKKNNQSKTESKKNKRNLDKIYGKKKSNVKIWSNSPKRVRKQYV
ncbi:hypothetical protein AAA799E16_00557 [Marine Group I thaumarchaeote SCGC AAA799-E16]|uniref:Uncharacterized protein n=2 Tax=Marine Group I TaxID=905826 RepID=A0A087S5M1_9ARCH|nr:hypothetical protein AAA799E16_00557 [Marine Group I thaumarchaeote SCGC AAA799-E16]KFM21025.1 hypothetical protein SCCGRSA3_00032 [Marine Group I thaumarchaeote SCGC RSA3]